MVRDERPRNDWSRQFDSVFKPRRNLPGSRRGRLLVVLSAFLVMETVLVATGMDAGGASTAAVVLWGVWLAASAAFAFAPQLGADQDDPGHQRVARAVAVGLVAVGLIVRVLLTGSTLPTWWLVATVSAAVAVAGMVLGVLAWRVSD